MGTPATACPPGRSGSCSRRPGGSERKPASIRLARRARRRDGRTPCRRRPAAQPAGRAARHQCSCPTLLLDENIVASATGFADIGVREPSPDGALLAWSADTTGGEAYALRITDLATGETLPDLVPRTCPGSAWSADSRYLFYVVPDQLHRPYQVWRHRVGTEASADVLVLAEDDARFELELRASRSGEVAIITSALRDTTEVRLIPMTDPERGPAVVAPPSPVRTPNSTSVCPRCSTAGSSTRSRTCAAAASAAEAGGSRAGCGRRQRRSTISSPSPTGWPGTRRARAPWSTAAGSYPAACPLAGCCRPLSTPGHRAAGAAWWPRCRSSTASTRCWTRESR